MKKLQKLIVLLLALSCLSCGNSVKKTAQNVTKIVASNTAKQTVKQTTKASIKKYSKQVVKSMTKEELNVFKMANYRETAWAINGKTKPILVSPKFDPHLTISRKYTGDFDPVQFHKGNPRYVRDGMETNLGRMKRGKAPLYLDPKNTKPEYHGFSPFELHHGGQKADPKYFALMAEEHSTATNILHPKKVGSEINRAEFSQKEREPLYKALAEVID
jgi:hypothetical protein